MEFEVIMKMQNIGVIGLGFVGTAVQKGFENTHTVFTYDINKECTEDSVESLVHKTNVIFICVPTPMNTDGSCNIDIVRTVLSQIANVKVQHKPVCVIKSTIPPGTTERLAQEFSSVAVAFNPEFLTERNFIDDFNNQQHIILGHTGKQLSIIPAIDVYKERFPNTKIHVVTSSEAELIKYVANTLLATKVAYLNQIFEICKASGINYETIKSVLIEDGRLGNTHWNVPGPDGKFGFGGTCFPKDTNALITYANSIGVNPTILQEVWNYNILIRPEKDWEMDKGRAVV